MPRAGLSTAAVVDLALSLIDERGPDALTLAAVAARAGVATPSLYKHVRNLDALRQKVSVAVTAELAEAMSAAAAGRSGADAVRAVAVAYRRYALGHPGRYAATQRVPDRHDPVHLAAAERAVGTLHAVLRGYGLRGQDAVDATRAMRAALHGFVSLEISGGFDRLGDLDRSFNRLICSLDVAFRAWRRRSDQQPDGDHRDPASSTRSMAGPGRPAAREGVTGGGWIARLP